MAVQDEIRQLNKTLSSEDSRCVPTLPPEIIVRILLILPAESLVSCISVCKLWCSLISDPHFIKSHLNLSSGKNKLSNHRLIFTNFSMVNLNICPLNDVLFNKSVDNVLELKLGYPFKQFEPLSIVGSCNGLLCIDVEGYSPIICNPVLKRSNRIPFGGFELGQRGLYVRYGFGYDEASDDYKVVGIPQCYRSRANKVNIYSLKTGKWKKIDDFPLGYPITLYGKFLNGAIHWMATDEYHCPDNSLKIVSLDLANERYGEVLQPVYDEGHNGLTLGILGDWLCVLCDYGTKPADVWVMKVYGVKDSWTKLVSIPYLRNPAGERFSVPLFLSKDEKILLKLGSELVLYDPKNRSFSEVRGSDQCLAVSMFVGSLVSPGRCFC